MYFCTINNLSKGKPMKIKTLLLTIAVLAVILFYYSCRSDKPEMTFSSQQIADDAQFLWAMSVNDVTGDRLLDLVFSDNNSSGGILGYYKGQTEEGLWEKVVIAKEAPGGGTFASGDLETGDIDGDGDIDIIAVKHTGEWDSADDPGDLYWYENPDWVPHFIGTVPDAVKDISITDFNNDKRIDLAVLCFESHNLSIFQHNIDHSFSKLKSMSIGNLHEGMDVGDMDNDGYTDIALNGFCLKNPKGNIMGEWIMETVDRKWHNQSGDWSANATKNFCADLNNDGRDEIFISHSERNGYPVSWYLRNQTEWIEHVIIDSLSSCHTLQVYDFDLDGDLDVLAGVNGGRAVNIGKTEFPVFIFVNDGTNNRWEPLKIAEGGIYNGRVADFDGDGDMDIFRLPDHEAKEVFLMINKIIK